MKKFVTIREVEQGEFEVVLVAGDGYGIAVGPTTYKRRGNAVRKATSVSEKKELPFFDSINEGLLFVAEIPNSEEIELEEIATAEPTPEAIEVAERTIKKPTKEVVFKAKYPWVKSIKEYNLDPQDPELDIFPLDQMTDRLARWIGKKLDQGVFSFKLVEVECEECGCYRVVKSQDVFQSSRCQDCKKAHKAKERKAKNQSA